ncbi:MAG: hypothetical protein HY879_15935 [Deltaproteobacteria bacterium]|nr:hypothetical protein [Deltaproteobacteria bacterium]
MNNLCKAYEKAHRNNNSAGFHELREVVTLVKTRGYDEASRLLKPGMADEDLRAFCWNVSSFLEDDELNRILNRPSAK